MSDGSEAAHAHQGAKPSDTAARIAPFNRKGARPTRYQGPVHRGNYAWVVIMCSTNYEAPLAVPGGAGGRAYRPPISLQGAFSALTQRNFLCSAAV